MLAITAILMYNIADAYACNYNSSLTFLSARPAIEPAVNLIEKTNQSESFLSPQNLLSRQRVSFELMAVHNRARGDGESSGAVAGTFNGWTCLSTAATTTAWAATAEATLITTLVISGCSTALNRSRLR